MAESLQQTPTYQQDSDNNTSISNPPSEAEQQRLREEIARLKQECQFLSEKDNVLKQNIIEVQEKIHDEEQK